MQKSDLPKQNSDWRQQRKLGSLIIAASAAIAAAIWLSIRFLAPPVSAITSIADALI